MGPGKSASEEKVVIFNEQKIREFMVKVWQEMSTNFGMIENLQDKLGRSPAKRRTKSRKNSNQKSVSIKSSKSRAKLKKKINSEKKKTKKGKSKGKSKKRKTGGNKSKEAKLDRKKLKLKMLKMNTVNRRSSTTDHIKKPSFSTKPQKQTRQSKGIRNRQVAWMISFPRIAPKKATELLRRCLLRRTGRN